ncbi:MAG: phosphoenolpyruvate carboxylase [Pseudomonadales bacterium]|nr:phosphoenolpyruvate carboxylase [Pseudomonadales bacterium]
MQELISRRLRHRVRILGELLGETMAELQGQSFLEKVEEIRLLAKSRREQGNTEHDALREVLNSLDDNYLISVARAFNQFLNLANIAEQAENIALQEKPFPESSRLAELFEKLKANEIDDEKIVDVVMNMKCELVLTAHPTEITRRTLIQKYNRIARQLQKVNENEELRQQDRLELERLSAEVWYTDEIRTEKPTPQDEAKWGYAVIEHSFWTAIPKIWEGIDTLLTEYTGTPLPLTAAPLQIASWMGGDRDGNPNVTAEVTEDVIRLGR